MPSMPAKMARSASRSPTRRRTAPATSAHTDTYHGRFIKLVPNELVIEVVEFETADPALQGEMTITFALADADDGAEIRAVHDALPPGLSAADNEIGWQQ